MTPSIQQFIDDLEKTLPDPCIADDLIDAGLFPSRYSLAQRRLRGQGPEFIKLGARQILYPKKAIMNWLYECAESKNKNDNANRD